MENVNYCQLCTVMLSLSFEYGVVNSRLDGIRIPRRPWNERHCSMVFFVVLARLMRGTSWRSSNIKGYLLQLAKLWEELVEQTAKIMVLRWLDTVFQGQYLPSLSINYVAKSKVFGKIATTVVLDEDENLL